MDLNKLIKKEEYSFPLLHPLTKEKLDIIITVYGNDSEFHKQVVLDMREGNGVSENVSVDDINKAGVEIAARCTKSWINMVANDEELECNKENALMIYNNEGWSWIIQQVREAIYTSKNYY